LYVSLGGELVVAAMIASSHSVLHSIPEIKKKFEAKSAQPRT
jgi:hypothetical protein